eukprot:scaffold4756_cov357-Prasinococcus_capsulatus_cf.AAC.8
MHAATVLGIPHAGAADSIHRRGEPVPTRARCSEALSSTDLSRSEGNIIHGVDYRICTACLGLSNALPCCHLYGCAVLGPLCKQLLCYMNV